MERLGLDIGEQVMLYIAFFGVVVAPFFIYSELRKLARLQRASNLYTRTLLQHTAPSIKLPDEDKIG